jgi:uncharacterized membrane protein
MIWDATRAERRTLRPHWGELRRARAEVRDAMTTDPFDLARYKAAHQRLLDAEIRVRNAAHTFFEMVATQLTVDERRQFAQWQLQSERPRKKRGGKHDADSGTGDPASGDHDAHFAKEPAAPEKR